MFARSANALACWMEEIRTIIYRCLPGEISCLTKGNSGITAVDHNRKGYNKIFPLGGKVTKVPLLNSRALPDLTL